MEKRLFTSGFATEGYPDRTYNATSDTILDVLIPQGLMNRVARETVITAGLVLMMGKITTNTYVDIQKPARRTVQGTGYNHGSHRFDCDTCGVITTTDEQSRDIALGVDKVLEAEENRMSEDEMDVVDVGDQGIMFGFAANGTEEYMPYGISVAYKLIKRLTKVRKNSAPNYLRPDGRSQVTMEYDGNNKPVRLEVMVPSARHDDRASQEQIHTDVKKHILDPIPPRDMADGNTKFFINSIGRFVIDGSHGDSGLTGWKIIVDIYGGYVRHGDGTFSDKDCTKVGRSAAYAARRAEIYLGEIK